MQSNINPKIIECLKKMRIYRNDTSIPFYAEFCLSLNFIERNNDLKTCAVNVTKKGLNFYYNNSFVEEISEQELVFIIIHEVLHLLSKHISRAKGYKPKTSNIVMDMIINYNIVKMVNNYRVNKAKNNNDKPKCFTVDGYDSNFNIAIPRFKDTEENRKANIVDKNTVLLIPNKYEGEHIFEPLYNWYIEQLNKKFDNEYKEKIDKALEDRKNKSSDDDSNDASGSGSDSDSQNGEPNNSSEGSDGNAKGNTDSSGSNNTTNNTNRDFSDTDFGNYGSYGKDDYQTFEDESQGLSELISDYIGEHLENEVDSEYAKSVVDDVFNRCKKRGLVTNDMESILSDLTKSREDILSKVLKEFDNSIYGGKFHDKSYLRPNRREIKGIKGRKKYNSKINVILDISGSMYGLLEIVLSYIFKRDVEVNLVLCDVEVKDHIVLDDTKKLADLKVKGFGGTIMQVGVNYVIENLNKYDTFLLTDGMTDTLDVSELNKQFIVISTTDEVNISNSNNKVKQFIIDENDF